MALVLAYASTMPWPIRPCYVPRQECVLVSMCVRMCVCVWFCGFCRNYEHVTKSTKLINKLCQALPLLPCHVTFLIFSTDIPHTRTHTRRYHLPQRTHACLRVSACHLHTHTHPHWHSQLNTALIPSSVSVSVSVSPPRRLCKHVAIVNQYWICGVTAVAQMSKANSRLTELWDGTAQHITEANIDRTLSELVGEWNFKVNQVRIAGSTKFFN